MSDVKVVCPICDEQIVIPKDTQETELIACSFCNNKLEVKKENNKFKLIEAPKVEEDWGE